MMIDELLSADSSKEALAWLQSGKPDSRMLGELPTTVASIEIVRELYALGAARVTAVIDQNILDLHEDQPSEMINDRGRRMKAKPIQRLCEHHGMPQLCSRSSTTNDNLFIELAFSTAKRALSAKP